jgi:hypothetical protein
LVLIRTGVLVRMVVRRSSTGLKAMRRIGVGVMVMLWRRISQQQEVAQGVVAEARTQARTSPRGTAVAADVGQTGWKMRRRVRGRRRLLMRGHELRLMQRRGPGPWRLLLRQLLPRMRRQIQWRIC